MPTTILDGETYEQARHRRFTEEAKVIEKIQQNEIIRMAQEACAPNQTFNSDEEWVKRFAALVAAHEREKRTQELMQLFLDPENQPTQFGTATLEYREQEVLAERERIICLLEGIDQTEIESPDGWWETSTGAAFGAERLAAIRARGNDASS